MLVRYQAALHPETCYFLQRSSFLLTVTAVSIISCSSCLAFSISFALTMVLNVSTLLPKTRFALTGIPLISDHISNKGFPFGVCLNWDSTVLPGILFAVACSLLIAMRVFNSSVAVLLLLSASLNPGVISKPLIVMLLFSAVFEISPFTATAYSRPVSSMRKNCCPEQDIISSPYMLT